MFDQLISGVKEQLGAQLPKEANVNSGQLDGIVSVLGDVTKKEVTKEMTGGSIGGLMNLFSNSGNNSAANSIQNNITSGVVSGLIEKLGFNGSTAKMIASTAVPLVMKMITDKNSETPEDDPSPLTNMFGGDTSSLLGGIASKFF